MSGLYSSYDKYDANTLENNSNDSGHKDYVNDLDVGKKDLTYVSSNKENVRNLPITSSEVALKNWDISCNYDEFNNSNPQVKTGDFTIKNMQCYFIINNKDGVTRVTLPDASDYPHYWGRKEIIIKNLYDYEVLSTSNNVKQLDSNDISDKIMGVGLGGKYISLVSDGKKWVIKSIF